MWLIAPLFVSAELFALVSFWEYSEASCHSFLSWRYIPANCVLPRTLALWWCIFLSALKPHLRNMASIACTLLPVSLSRAFCIPRLRVSAEHFFRLQYSVASQQCVLPSFEPKVHSINVVFCPALMPVCLKKMYVLQQHSPWTPTFICFQNSSCLAHQHDAFLAYPRFVILSIHSHVCQGALLLVVSDFSCRDEKCLFCLLLSYVEFILLL